MSIGCSITEGVGVNDNETWPHEFCKLIPNGVDLNFGCGGRSNDYITRCLMAYYDIIKPDLVLIMYTESHRREFYTNEGGIEPFHHKSWGYFKEDMIGINEHNAHLTLLNKSNNFINWYKNHNDWKPLHHDASFIKPHIAKIQNFTLAISFGSSRDAVFEKSQHNGSKTYITMPQPNGSIYAFCNDTNAIWKHGILQGNQNDSGRISIILWGWMNNIH